MTFKSTEFNVNLTAAVQSFDRQATRQLCDQLIEYLRDADAAYPLKNAKIVLNQLRRQRYFDLMQSVADALIQNGQDDAFILRQYAQSLLDLGHITAAISILHDLERITAADGVKPNQSEYEEARGLLGRAYKDLYTLAPDPGRGRNRQHLEQAIACYRSIYAANQARIWQGINSVALLLRAASEGLELDNIADPKRLAQSMAAEILQHITEKHQNQQAEAWDFATAVEACIGLERHDDALEWLNLYLPANYADAFEFGSTFRQLTQVWKLTATQPPGDRLLPALQGALLKRQGSVMEIDITEADLVQLDRLSGDQVGLEQVFGSEGFRTVKWFHKCLKRAAAVARVEDQNGMSVGTAFVVRGGDLKPELGEELLLLTNAHVISSDANLSRALRPDQAIVRFDLWRDGVSPEFLVEQLWTSPPDELDATLLRPTPPIDQHETIPISPGLPLKDRLQRAYIIGHPQGRPLSFSIHDNYILDYDGRLLHYRSPTEPGNSGSPVLNDNWEVIGLHHRGLHAMPKLHGIPGTYPANEGICIQAIVQGMAAAALD
ncbi:MAG: hypothetical protein RLZZ609_666 [Cyanobacteriota bacterium]|jgi:tetratricopeptide (TPR) repeat protein